MEYRSVGRSGLAVSSLGLGCNNFGMKIGEAESTAVVGAALDGGVTLFDTADIYGGGRSEEMLGKALRGVRHDVVIATKFGITPKDARAPRGGSRRHLIAACEASLKRLGTDYIDLYFLHKPDPLTPIEETLAALGDLIRAGKVRYIGVSNMAAWQMIDADHRARALKTERFIAAQTELSLLNRAAENAFLPAARHAEIGVMTYFPLASGLLTGKYGRGVMPPGSRLATLPAFADTLTEENLRRVDTLTALATRHGLPLIDFALSWCVSQPGVSTVLFGATTADQVHDNLRAASRVLPAELSSALDLTGSSAH